MVYVNDFSFLHACRGRNSNNDLIRARLGWAPSTRLIDGLRKTYEWVKDQVARDEAAGKNVHALEYTSSRVVLRQQLTENGHATSGKANGARHAGWKAGGRLEEEELEQKAA